MTGNKPFVIPAARSISELETLLDYTFTDTFLLEMALTHRSYAFETPGAPSTNNEKLEFLGDAVLAYVSAEYLYETFPHLSEGELTDVRAALVKSPTLAQFSRTIELGTFLRLGKGEEQTGGRDRETVIASAFEAVIGAILLDSSIATARTIIIRFLKDDAHRLIDLHHFKDDKSTLQEIVQSHISKAPTYVILTEDGPPHRKIYHVAVKIGEHVLGQGTGLSKRKAEQEAAHDALIHQDWQENGTLDHM